MTDPIINKLSASEGLNWIGRSFSLYGKSASIWIVMLVLYFGINLIFAMIPMMDLLPTLVAPLFTVGFYIGCKALEDGKMLQIDHLFEGFKKNAGLLFRLGIFYFGFNLIIFSITSVYLANSVPESVVTMMTEAKTTQEMELVFRQHPDLLSSVLNSAMLALLLSIPLVMASWYAPALVYFNNIPPFKAMLLSIKACNRNLSAYLVFGLLMFPLLILAILPFGLGLLVMLPVTIISQYVSYRATFSFVKEDSEDGDDEGVLTL